MSIRVIAGTAKGRKLKLVPGDSTRPIMDKVKEALFSILGQRIVDATFLDLFGGTGSVGIEALSRGARQVVFVELERLAIQTIRDNLKTTRLDGRAVVYRGDALQFIPKTTTPFDFIFVAPPQYKGLWSKTLLLIDAHPIWPAVAQIIVQIDPEELRDASPQLNQLELYDERRYGRTMLLFYRGKDAVTGGRIRGESLT